MSSEADRRYSSIFSSSNQNLVTSAFGTVVDMVDLVGAQYKSLTLNTSGGSAFSGCLVQAAPEFTSGTTWETVDGTTFTTLGTGVTKTGIYNDNRRYWRVRGSTTAGSVTSNSWWSV